MIIFSALLLVIAIFAAVRFPHAKGGNRVFLIYVMLASTAGFMFDIVHFAHPGM